MSEQQDQGADRRAFLGLVAGSGLMASTAQAAPPAPASALPLDLVFSARIEVGKPVEQGMVDGRRQRFIPITGGTVSGPKLKGIVLPVGGDWQTILPGGLTQILARYALQAEDGTVISITNPGVRTATAEVVERLSKGEDVDPSLYYFRTTPVFEVASGPYDWMRRHVFIGRGIRRPDHVLMEVYQVG
jgi:hypothetical protein